MFFPDQEYRVAEDIGEVLIPVLRTGDLSDETMVICSTVQGLCCVCLRVHALIVCVCVWGGGGVRACVHVRVCVCVCVCVCEREREWMGGCVHVCERARMIPFIFLSPRVYTYTFFETVD